jgi:replication initiation protein RepC
LPTNRPPRPRTTFRRFAVRHAEFAAIAYQADAERKARSDLRRRLTIARKAIQQLAETAVEHAVAGRDWLAWLEQARSLAAEAVGEGIPLAMLEAAAADLERRRAEGESSYQCVACERVLRGGPICPPYYNYKPTLS